MIAKNKSGKRLIRINQIWFKFESKWEIMYGKPLSTLEGIRFPPPPCKNLANESSKQLREASYHIYTKLCKYIAMNIYTKFGANVLFRRIIQKNSYWCAKM